MTSDALTVLLVEDNPIDVRMVQRAFRKRKLSNPLRVANDGIEALEILRGASGHSRLQQPYIVLLDLRMPRMGGLLCLEEIRNDDELKKSVVYIMTTSEDNEEIKTAYEQHVAGYINKRDAGPDFSLVMDLIKKYELINRFPN